MQNLKLIPGITFLMLLFFHPHIVSAHGRYILPSHTVLSGQNEQTVSFTASISNDIFHPDMPLGSHQNSEQKLSPMLQNMFKQLQTYVIQPDGQKSPMNWHAMARFSVADLNPTQDGTYKVVMFQPAFLLTTFKREDGVRDRVFGPNPKIPDEATEVVKRQVSSRVETFISKNAPNRRVLEQLQEGLELGGVSHPNDLFINEPVQLQLFYNGQALKQKAEIILVYNGTKHRNQREEIKITSDTQGNFQYQFTQAGFYWLEVDYSLPGEKGSGIDWQHFTLYTTLEVFP